MGREDRAMDVGKQRKKENRKRRRGGGVADAVI